QASWHYVTEEELASDLVYVYPVLIAPFLRAISDETIGRLGRYVEDGGVLIADVVFGYYDRWGKIRRAGEGGDVERLFGAWVDQVHDNRTGDRAIEGLRLPGFTGDLVATRARPLLHYEDGATAATVAQRGRGAAVLLGFDAGTACAAPGATGFEAIVQRLVRVFAPRRYESSVPLTYRLRAPGADHYFIVNDGAARDAVLTPYDVTYRTAADVLTGSEIDVRPVLSVPVSARSGAWIRCEHEETHET
ncbi:MAG: beta-galactosidase trimerization domain-containing protein, partial [Spirochaetota bacterium]